MDMICHLRCNLEEGKLSSTFPNKSKHKALKLPVDRITSEQAQSPETNTSQDNIRFGRHYLEIYIEQIQNVLNVPSTYHIKGQQESELLIMLSLLRILQSVLS
jgi:hypothetical protein